MDDSFRVRVDKIFGSLATPKSSFHSASPWSVTADEVERRKWKRNSDTSVRDEMPCSASFDSFLKEDRRRNARNINKELDDDGGNQPYYDEWKIRTSIGLDPTLDNEEEEDEFDKVAAGRENAGDRLYMGSVNDHGPYLNSNVVLSDSFHGTDKDRRANHLAANIKLKEDEVEGKDHYEACDSDKKEQLVQEYKVDIQPRSILKRKETDLVSNLQKRVRFEPGCESNCQEASKSEKNYAGPFLTNPASYDEESVISKNTSELPDYVINFSNYTHYSFDSMSEVDEESKTQACRNFLTVSESRSELVGASDNLKGSVIFVPKKKANDAVTTNTGMKVKHKENNHNMTAFPVGVAAGQTQLRNDITTEEEDQDIDEVASCKKTGRGYRTISSLDD